MANWNPPVTRRPPMQYHDTSAAADPLGALSPADRNAADFLISQFDSYGLGSLASTIVNYVKQGYGADTINLLLQQTPEYKQRFAANDIRRANGLPVLSPAEYLATERQYRQILQSYGLPSGFYDQPSDFTSWLGSDVSPSEINDRAKLASDAVQNTDPAYRQALQSYYGIDSGHLAAYFLDQSRALPLLQKQATAAQIGGSAITNNIGGVDSGQAERLAGLGVTADQARQGFGDIAQMMPTAGALSAIYGQQYGTQDAINDVLLNDGTARQKRANLASSERAAFSGSTGLGRGSLDLSSDNGQL